MKKQIQKKGVQHKEVVHRKPKMVNEITPKKSIQSKHHLKETNFHATLTDIEETETEYVIRTSIPGVSIADIEIFPAEHSITIKAEKKNNMEFENKESGTLRKEELIMGYYEQIPLPDDAEGSSVIVGYDKGILELHVLKTPHANKYIQ